MFFSDSGHSYHMIGLQKSNGVVAWMDGTPFDPNTYGSNVHFQDSGNADATFRACYHSDFFNINSFSNSWKICQIKPF